MLSILPSAKAWPDSLAVLQVGWGGQGGDPDMFGMWMEDLGEEQNSDMDDVSPPVCSPTFNLTKYYQHCSSASNSGAAVSLSSSLTHPCEQTYIHTCGASQMCYASTLRSQPTKQS